MIVWANYRRNVYKFPKNAILKKGHKIPMIEGAPAEISAELQQPY